MLHHLLHHLVNKLHYVTIFYNILFFSISYKYGVFREYSTLSNGTNMNSMNSCLYCSIFFFPPYFRAFPALNIYFFCLLHHFYTILQLTALSVNSLHFFNFYPLHFFAFKFLHFFEHSIFCYMTI